MSTYVQSCLSRRRRVGHLFQGRDRAELVEDESDYWTVSRDIHLNPVRAGLVHHPAEWPWSSYPDIADPARGRPWIACEPLLNAWRGENGGLDPSAESCRFVKAGLAEPPSPPFREAFGGWVLGSDRFMERLRGLAGPVVGDPAVPEARPLAGLRAESVCAVVARHYGLDPSAFSHRRGPIEPRSVAAWLCRRHTEAPLRELAPRLGLSRAGSVSNLTRRIEARLRRTPELAAELDRVLGELSA